MSARAGRAGSFYDGEENAFWLSGGEPFPEVDSRDALEAWLRQEGRSLEEFRQTRAFRKMRDLAHTGIVYAPWLLDL